MTTPVSNTEVQKVKTWIEAGLQSNWLPAVVMGLCIIILALAMEWNKIPKPPYFHHPTHCCVVAYCKTDANCHIVRIHDHYYKVQRCKCDKGFEVKAELSISPEVQLLEW